MTDSDAPRPWLEATERLAERLLAGELVFFVGSGFSVDSEGNTARRMVGRLFVRFLALVRLDLPENKGERLLGSLIETFSLEKVLRRSAGSAAAKLEIPAAALEKAIRKKGSLRLLRDSKKTVKILEERLRHAEADPSRLPERVQALFRFLLLDVISALSSAYYMTNDWMSTAFGEILTVCLSVAKLDDDKLFSKLVNEEENRLLRLTELGGPRIRPIELSAYRRLEGQWARGKALFLDTQGFDCDKAMAGDPSAKDLRKVQYSYRGSLGSGSRLRFRHFVLARLAREGIASPLLTTNFDLLLEGAYRLSGFEEPPQDQSPQASSGRAFFNRISEASDFFNRGSGHRNALLVKIHGCAETYRKKRATALSNNASSGEPWPEYLARVIFTFREIQNWREDAWSRDLLRTLLRTRTMAFCGYSGADPVLHDTFRTVYEEMSRSLNSHATESPAADEQPAEPSRESLLKGARAFYIGMEGLQEFHGTEILRAASQAAGVLDPGLEKHPNYIQFHPLGSKGFPDLDELLLWIYHRVIRLIQARALRLELDSIVTSLLGRPGRQSELNAVRANFDRLLEAERSAAELWGPDSSEKPHFYFLVSWSYSFLPGLLREFFLLREGALRDQGMQSRLDRRHLYFPASRRTQWTAWATVVELAIRRMTAAWGGVEDWTRHWSGLRPQDGSDCLQVSFHCNGGSAAAAKAAASAQPGGLTFSGAPPAEEIWRWACETSPRISAARAARWLLDRSSVPSGEAMCCLRIGAGSGLRPRIRWRARPGYLSQRCWELGRDASPWPTGET